MRWFARDGAHRQRPHAPDYTTESREIVDVLRELRMSGMDHMGLECGEGDAILAEDVHDRELSAE